MSPREAGERAAIKILWDIFRRLPEVRREELLKRAKEREPGGEPDDSGCANNRQAGRGASRKQSGQTRGRKALAAGCNLWPEQRRITVCPFDLQLGAYWRQAARPAQFQIQPRLPATTDNRREGRRVQW